jgi:ANTAR domain
MRGTDTDADPVDGRVSRIQTLLVSVRDIASSLHRLSAQLEREVGPALVGSHRPPGEDGETGPLAALRQENAQLRGALDARAVIEQAKGMLMVRHQCSAERAFELLVGMSQSEQRKVRDIAADIVAGALEPTPADPPLAVLRAGRPEEQTPAAGPNGEAPRTPVRIDLAAAADRAASGRRRGGG